MAKHEQKLDLFRRCAAQQQLRSFTLVETVIAISVTALFVISVVSLMAFSQRLVQQADNYSRLATITAQLESQFDRQPFTVSTNCAYAGAVYYMTAGGLPTNSARAYYVCDVTNANPSTWTLTNMMQVQIRIRWPAPEFTSTNTVITSTLNYE